MINDFIGVVIEAMVVFVPPFLVIVKCVKDDMRKKEQLRKDEMANQKLAEIHEEYERIVALNRVLTTKF